MLATFTQIAPSDGNRVGGKALNCVQLRRAGFPVPDGLVVTTDTPDAELSQLPHHRWITAHPEAQRFAVRSSGVGEDGAGHSFAGIHETFLDVTRADLTAAVRACLLSTSSEQARAYRSSHGLPDDARAGVLIQPMVRSLMSGVAFTRDPITGVDDLLIETAPGLGDDLVSGRVQPDRYRVRSVDGVAVERTIVPGRAPLPENVLEALTQLLRQVQTYLGGPQDVEWAWDGAALWLLQARPITTQTAEPVSRPATLLSDPRHPVSPVPSPRADVEWTRANLAEVIPDQASPQALDAYVHLLNAAQRKFAGRLLAADAELGPPFAAIGGRMYFNLSQLIRMAQLGGAPPAAAKRSLGHSEGLRLEDEIHTPPAPGTLLRLVPDIIRLAWLDLRAPHLVRKLDRDNAIATARMAVPDPDLLDDMAILDLLTEWREAGPDRMVVVLVHGGVVLVEEQLRKACRAVGVDYESFVYPHLATGVASVSTQQAFDLVELAEIARGEAGTAAYLIDHGARVGDYRAQLAGSRFLLAFDRFLERYGHRGLYESDWSLPRYREDPSPLLSAIRTHLLNPPAESRDAIRERLARDAAAAWAEFDARLSAGQRLTLKPWVRFLLARLKSRYVGREYCRSELVKVLYHARQLQLALARRFVARGWIDTLDDYFMLLASEIEAVIHGTASPWGLRAIVGQRRDQLAWERTLSMPLYLRQSEVRRVLAGHAGHPGRHTASAAQTADGLPGSLAGLCVSRGTVEADVVVIRDPREFAQMRRGAILVAPATDPSWTPLFTLAAGIIVELGGVLSHASTVAREYGLPALANVKNATTWLRTGDRVRLDASGGHVQLLRRGASPTS